MMAEEAVKVPLQLPVYFVDAGYVGACKRGETPPASAHNRLIVVRQGKLIWKREADKFDVKTGEALLLRPGETFAVSSGSDGDTRYYWVEFGITPYESMHGIQITRTSRLCRPDVVYEQFQRLLQDCSSGAATLISSALYVLLLLTEVEQHKGKLGYGNLVRQASVLLNERYDSPLSVIDIANILGCNAEYLGRIYHAATGETMHAARNVLRVRKACVLLSETSSSMAEVAEKCGFTSQTYFCRVFRSLRGITPLQYRRVYSNTDK